MSYPTREMTQQRRVAEAERLGGAWRALAACQGHEVATFFPEDLGSGYPKNYGPGLAVCRDCPVLTICRDWATAAGDIVDGHTLHGQVVGGCAPKPRYQGRPELLRPRAENGHFQSPKRETA